MCSLGSRDDACLATARRARPRGAPEGSPSASSRVTTSSSSASSRARVATSRNAERSAPRVSHPIPPKRDVRPLVEQGQPASFPGVEKASKKQDAPAANALPTSVLLQRVLAPDRGKWKGGALKRVGDGLRENEERAAHPKLNMGQPAPRPPAPTARFGVNPLSRGAPSAPAVNGSAGRHTQSAPVVDDAMREHRWSGEGWRRCGNSPPARPRRGRDRRASRPRSRPLPTSRARRKRTNKMRRERLRRSRSALRATKRNAEALRRRAAPRACARATAPDQFLGVELFLAHEASPDGSVETFDRLHVRSLKSFPGYPANAVLSWATSPASPAGETKKWLLEKGEVSVWRVTPATAYRALLDRAKREPLLAVQDAVASRVARAGAARDAADQTLARAEEECAALGADVPADVAEARARLGLAQKKRFGLRTRRRRTRARSVRLPSWARRGGARLPRRRRSPGRAAFLFPSRDSRAPRGNRGTFLRVSRDGSSDAERGKRAETSASSELEPREVGGFDEKGLASVLAAATQLAPGRRVSPATADAADFVRVCGTRRGSTAWIWACRDRTRQKRARRARALRDDRARASPGAARGAPVRVPDGFRARASTLAKADAKKSKAGAAVLETRARPRPRARRAGGPSARRNRGRCARPRLRLRRRRRRGGGGGGRRD